MIESDPPLLVMADMPPDYRLTDLSLSGDASEIISLSTSERQGLNRLEAMIGGMTFTLIHYRSNEISERFSAADWEPLFYESPETNLSGIGIALGEHIAAAKHSRTINRALLQLAQHVGQAIGADSIAWRPAQLNIGFDYFVGATDHYVAGGPFPVLAQIAISESPDGIFQTSGLSYFADQEIRLGKPAGYSPNELIKRLVRIAHDIATNGKIDEKVEADGFVQGEKLSITPNDNGKFVDIAIVTDGPRQLR